MNNALWEKLIIPYTVEIGGSEKDKSLDSFIETIESLGIGYGIKVKVAGVFYK